MAIKINFEHMTEEEMNEQLEDFENNQISPETEAWVNEEIQKGRILTYVTKEGWTGFRR